jgi:hypothetical protein
MSDSRDTGAAGSSGIPHDLSGVAVDVRNLKAEIGSLVQVKGEGTDGAYAKRGPRFRGPFYTFDRYQFRKVRQKSVSQ